MQTQTVTPPTELASARDSRVTGHIREASDVTGVPFEYLLAQANQESRLDPDARSRRSTAMGLYQFTAGTWLEMVKTHGADHGLDKYADAITKGSDGRWKVADKGLKKEILDLRKDPKTSALMAGEYAKDNERWLEQKLRRQVSAHDLYLAHFLGAGGALRVIKGMQDTPKDIAASHLPEAADANPEVFHERSSGQSRSLSSLYKSVRARFQHSMDDVGAMARRVRPPVDLASLRPPARPSATVPVANRPDSEIESPISDATMMMADIASPVSPAAALQPAAMAQAFIGPQASTRTAALVEFDQQFPVRLPPPLRGTRSDGPMLRILLDTQDKKA